MGSSANHNHQPLQAAASSGSDDRPPLFVDLDDTIILGDTLWESFAMLVRQNPLAALAALFSLLRGRAAFKQTVARQTPFSPELLRYNDQVVAFVRQEAALGRPTVLATAADSRIADAVAAHLQSRGIATAVYYPKSLHLQPVYDELGHRAGDFPVSEAAQHEVLSLPMYPELTGSQLREVVDALMSCPELHAV